MAAGKRGILVAGTVSVVIGGSVGALAAWLADVSWLLAALLALLCLFVFYAVSAYGLWDKADRAREATLTGVKDRFETLRYALALGGFGAHISRNADGETWDVAVWVVVTNSSAEPLRCDTEELTATIQGQRSEEESESPVAGVVVQPDGSTTVLSGFVRGVALPWQEASLQFTALYGHPAGGPRYRKSQGYRLLTFSANRLFWKNAADIGLGAVLTSNPEVQDASPV